MSAVWQDVIKEFPLRHTSGQKESFRNRLVGILKGMGYPAQVQSKTSFLGQRVSNVVAGDPDRAELLLLARYDTPIRSLLPPLILPTRPATALLYQALTPVLVIAGALVLSFAVTFPMRAPSLTLPLFLALLVGAMAYLRFGPPETRNLDDNSSGVAALLETAAAITPGNRDKVALVFTVGLGGAKAFRERYPSAKEKPVIVVNCVAGGDELLLLPNRKLRWDAELLDALLDSFDDPGGREAGTVKEVFLKTDGFVYYPGDNRAFPQSLVLCAPEKAPGLGRVIRPRKAEAIEEKNLSQVKNGLSRLTEKYKSGKK